MKVLKFGGTSVGTAERMQHVARLVSSRGKNIIVLSAMAGTTNSLVEICDYLRRKNTAGARDIVNGLEQKYEAEINGLFLQTAAGVGSRGGALVGAAARAGRERAREAVNRCFAYIKSLIGLTFSEEDEKEILAQGELMSTAMMLEYLKFTGTRAVMLPALKFMRTDEQGEPHMEYITRRLQRLIDLSPDADLYLTQGFICRNEFGDVDNLQRGGSDYTASIIGAALELEEIEIWTDIDGLHNNDPRYVKNTKPVSELHFEEAAELAYFGAKILHPACVLPARLHNIPIRLLNTMEPDKPGTLIHSIPSHGTIKAVSARDNVTVIAIKSGRMFLAYSFLMRVFQVFEDFKTPVHMVATSEVGVTVAVDTDAKIPQIVDALKEFGTVEAMDDMTIVCVAGDLQWMNAGLEGRVLEAIGKIPVRAVSYGGSAYNIAFVIRQQDKIEVLQRLSNKLFPETQHILKR